MSILTAILSWFAANPELTATIIAALFEGYTVWRNWTAEQNKAALLLKAYKDLQVKREGIQILADSIEQAGKVIKATYRVDPVKRIVAERSAESPEAAAVIDEARRLAERAISGKPTAPKAASHEIDAELAAAKARSFVSAAGLLRLLNPFHKP